MIGFFEGIVSHLEETHKGYGLIKYVPDAVENYSATFNISHARHHMIVSGEISHREKGFIDGRSSSKSK